MDNRSSMSIADLSSVDTSNVKGMRGMWYGLYRGLNHDKTKPDKRGLSDAVNTEVNEIFQFMAYGEFADLFHLADSLTNLYFDNKNYCGGNELASRIIDHCHSEDKPCAFGSIFNNVGQKHAIELMGAGSVLADTYHNLDLNVEPDEWFEQTQQLAKQAGLILAFMLDF